MKKTLSLLFALVMVLMTVPTFAIYPDVNEYGWTAYPQRSLVLNQYPETSIYLESYSGVTHNVNYAVINTYLHPSKFPDGKLYGFIYANKPHKPLDWEEYSCIDCQFPNTIDVRAYIRKTPDSHVLTMKVSDFWDDGRRVTVTTPPYWIENQDVIDGLEITYGITAYDPAECTIYDNAEEQWECVKSKEILFSETVPITLIWGSALDFITPTVTTTIATATFNAELQNPNWGINSTTTTTTEVTTEETTEETSEETTTEEITYTTEVTSLTSSEEQVTTSLNTEENTSQKISPFVIWGIVGMLLVVGIGVVIFVTKK